MNRSATAVQSEREMIPPLLTWLRSLTNRARTYGVTAIEQQLVGKVIPDVLMGIWRTDPRKLSRESFTIVETHVLALLEAMGPLSLDELAEPLYLNRFHAERTLHKLMRLRAVDRRRDGAYELAARARTTAVDIIAVEAKIRRWRQALAQAMNYRRFADESYVIVDSSQVRLTNQMCHAFSQAGVGLLMLDGCVVTLSIPAAKQRRYTPDRVRAADRLYIAARASL